ncbi:MAG: ribosome-associated translation inhibitor RaiA [Crocinitomicaceae bacterium]
MDLNVHAVHFNADEKLVNFVNGKVSKLENFFDNIIAGEVYLKVDKAKKKENKVAEIKLSVPGKELFAKKQCDSFEEAADLACKALRRQVRKHKTKKK